MQFSLFTPLPPYITDPLIESSCSYFQFELYHCSQSIRACIDGAEDQLCEVGVIYFPSAEQEVTKLLLPS